MKTATQGLYFPDEKKYRNRLLAWVEQAMKRWEACPMSCCGGQIKAYPRCYYRE